jgi:5-methyltetrahydropteroyltriglutamate--homocysteine methyltransferase
MNTRVDDVGSFPLPSSIDRKLFDQAYTQARQAISVGKNIKADKLLSERFRNVVVESFRRKCASGLDVINYPQHYDMHRQVTDVITQAMESGTYVVDRENAVLPEVCVINDEAKRLCEEFGKRISLRVCVAGPFELYLKMVGTVCHKDVLFMFAETVRRFAENSILNSKFIKTEVLCLDEPSFGFLDVSGDRDTLLGVLEKAFSLAGVTKQVHLHSSLRVVDLLDVGGLDVLSLEFAASPRNLEGLSRKMLEGSDKYVRVGVARTDIDSIRAELYDKGVVNPSADQFVEAEETMRRRFNLAKERYGDRLLFAGPDCGLGGWPSQEAAELLLKRTVRAVKKA